MEISAIIPTYNRGSLVLDTLESLLKQTLPPDQFEVVVVDDASPDDTKEHVEKFLNDRDLHTWKCISLDKNGGRAAAINAGVLAASGKIVVFTDDDIIPVPEWIEAHLARHNSEEGLVGVVGAVSYPDEWIRGSNLVRFHNSTYLGTAENRMTALLKAGSPPPPNNFAGGNSSLSRDVLLEVGLYDAKMRRGQDGELGIRLARHGVRFAFEPKAKVIHYADAASSYEKWLKSFQNFYRENAQLIEERYPEEYNQFFHWFVERPSWGKESGKRSLVKTLVRVVARPQMGRMVAFMLEACDDKRLCYCNLLYKYVLTCMAIEAVNERKRNS